MKNLKSTIITLMLFTPFLLIGQAGDMTTPCDVDAKEYENIGYEKGHEAGKQEGIEIGEARGEKRGKEKGIKIGKAFAIKAYIDSLDKGTDAWYEIVSKYAYWKSKSDDLVIKWEDAFGQGYEKGSKKAHKKAYMRGYNYAIDSAYRIHLKKGQNISLENYDYYPSIRYNIIASKLVSITDESDYPVFAEAVNDVHMDILAYLVNRLGLNPKERKEVFAEYAKIHPKLSEMYLRKFLKLRSTKHIAYNKDYYDYHHYHTMDAFLDIFRSGICSVSDVVITYAKGNSQFATINGLEVMGHLCEIIINEFLFVVEDYFTKSAVRLSYNENIGTLNGTCRKMLVDMNVRSEVRIDRVTETISLSEGCEAKVTMDIITVFNVGFDLTDFQLLVQHNDQQFRFDLPNTPRVLEIVSQTYKVVEIQNTTTYKKVVNKYSLSGNREVETEGSKKCTTSESDLEAIFNKHKPTIDELDPALLKRQEVETALIILRKTIEPAVVLPSSCYSVKLKFTSSRLEDLVEINCK